MRAVRCFLSTLGRIATYVRRNLKMSTSFATVALFVATLTVGVIYGVDVFFAIIGRSALARTRNASLVDVMGHLHAVADARMLIFGATSIVATLAFVILEGFA